MRTHIQQYEDTYTYRCYMPYAPLCLSHARAHTPARTHMHTHSLCLSPPYFLAIRTIITQTDSLYRPAEVLRYS